MDTHSADVHLLSYLVGGQTLSPELVDLVSVYADLAAMADIHPVGFGFGDTLSLSFPDDVTLELSKSSHHLKLQCSEGVILTVRCP